MKIAVLGGGNGSLAAAADLGEAGHQVHLWRRDPAVVDAMPKLHVKDHAGTRPARLDRVTSDLAAAVDGAELIVCPTPATAHDELFKRLAGVLMPGQVVFLPPGSFGSWMLGQQAPGVMTAEYL